MNRAYTDLAKIRIYFEGVLFPYAKSVSVSEGVGSVTATVEVPPSLKLRPEEMIGMMCHIFYANKRVLHKWGDPGHHGAPINDGWPILFQGEMTGEYSNVSVESESVSLTFLSHARHFEQVHMYFYDGSRQDLKIDHMKQAQFLGSSKIELEMSGTPLSKKTQIHTSLTARMENLGQDTERNIAFQAAVLDILRGATETHPVFAYFNSKLKLINRFAAYVDPDVKNILGLELLADVVDKRVHGMPEHTSLMQLMEIPASIMKYNWNQIAQPSLRQAPPTETRSPGMPVEEVNAKLRKAVQQFGQRTVRSSLNVPLDIGTIAIPADYFESSTWASRVISSNDFIERVYNEYLYSLSQNIEPDKALFDAFQKVVGQNIIPSVGRIASELSKTKQSTATSTEVSSEELDQALATPVDQENEKKEEQTLISLDQETLMERDELNEFIITPGMEFSHPPRCNVLMPSTFSSYGITRNYLQEPTRLYGRVPIVPAAQQDNIAIEVYIAPFAQAYHKLEGNKLAVFDEAYDKILKGQINQVPPEGLGEAAPIAMKDSSLDGGFSSYPEPDHSSLDRDRAFTPLVQSPASSEEGGFSSMDGGFSSIDDNG